MVPGDLTRLSLQIPRFALRLVEPAAGAFEGALPEGSFSILRHFTALQLVDDFAVIVRKVITQLFTHLARPPGNAARIVLVDVAKHTGIGEAFQPGFLALHHADA